MWFDVHGDVHALASSASGNLGGMALRMTLGGDAEKLAGPLGLRPLREDRALLVGVRDLDAPEVAYLATSAIRQWSMKIVRAHHLPDGPILQHMRPRLGPPLA